MMKRLEAKIGLADVRDCANWASQSAENFERLWRMSYSENLLASQNALWIMTHLGETKHLETKQPQLIERLLTEQTATKKRLFLQLLRRQEFDADNEHALQLLEYCFRKINSECEPYAVRANCIYIALKISRPYPELIAELAEHLNLLSKQSLSPGLISALRQTKRKISKLL